jgi:glycerol-3-phosphate dehydrogenase
LRHAIEREHARTVTDVLARRCRLAMVDQADAERLVPEVQSLLADSRTNCNLAEPSIDLRL